MYPRGHYRNGSVHKVNTSFNSYDTTGSLSHQLVCKGCLHQQSASISKVACAISQHILPRSLTSKVYFGGVPEADPWDLWTLNTVWVASIDKYSAQWWTQIRFLLQLRQLKRGGKTCSLIHRQCMRLLPVTIEPLCSHSHAQSATNIICLRGCNYVYNWTLSLNPKYPLIIMSWPSHNLLQ